MLIRYRQVGSPRLGENCGERGYDEVDAALRICASAAENFRSSARLEETGTRLRARRPARVLWVVGDVMI
jgi:hypothetical protein